MLIADTLVNSHTISFTIDWFQHLACTFIVLYIFSTRYEAFLKGTFSQYLNLNQINNKNTILKQHLNVFFVCFLFCRLQYKVLQCKI